jgi:hypothetical protein
MNPNASLKSLKTKVRAIASRPAVSVHPGNPFRADFLASADSRSAMIASRFHDITLTPIGTLGIHATIRRQSRSKAGQCGQKFSSPSLRVDQENF